MGPNGAMRALTFALCLTVGCSSPASGDEPDASSSDGGTTETTPVGDAVVVPSDGGEHPPLDSTCRFARATRYPIARKAGVPQGTCGFGPVAADMPDLFQKGYVTAPNEAFYNRGGVPAAACGECFELSGSVGAITVMAADICDIACCDNCRGDVVAFDVDDSHWKEIVDQTGGNVSVGYHPVACPVSGNLKAYFTSGYQAGDRFRLVVYNHRIGVDAVEFKGSASGATKGAWVPLVRTVDNYFDWTGRGDAGLPITLRVKSTKGQWVEFAPLDKLSADLKIVATGQFDDPALGGATCAWPGPEDWVYKDALGGILGLQWRDWGSYELLDGAPDYAHEGGCQAGAACIRVGRMNAWGAIQIGFPNTFAPSTYAAIEFWARTESGTAPKLKFYFNGKDASGAAATGKMADLGLVDATWRKFRIDLAPLVGTVDRAQVVRVSNQSNDPTPAVLLDEIHLVRP